MQTLFYWILPAKCRLRWLHVRHKCVRSQRKLRLTMSFLHNLLRSILVYQIQNNQQNKYNNHICWRVRVRLSCVRLSLRVRLSLASVRFEHSVCRGSLMITLYIYIYTYIYISTISAPRMG